MTMNPTRMPARVLVLGGAGYIGSHALRLLLRSGHEAWAYDSLVTGHAAAVPPGRLVLGELHDTEHLAQVLRSHRIEAVMHFAAFALVGESMANPAKYYRNNVVGTLSLLEAMRQAGVARLVFSSTTATYGVPQRLPITEEAPQRPINPYGASKLAAEQAITDYCHAYGLAAVILRYFNAAGAGADGMIGEDHEPETHLIPNLLKVAGGTKAFCELHGGDYPTPDGTCIRDYVHVDDLADAHLRALDAMQAGQALKLNLGNGRGYSVNEIVEACRRVTGHALPVRLGPRRAGDPPELVADSSRARTVLGWSPRSSAIDQIVGSAWQWHRHHPRGYADAPAAPGGDPA